MNDELRAYYERRCDDERAAAERSPDRGAAEIHRALAARYEALLGNGHVGSRGEPLSQLRKVQ